MEKINELCILCGCDSNTMAICDLKHENPRGCKTYYDGLKIYNLGVRDATKKKETNNMKIDKLKKIINNIDKKIKKNIELHGCKCDFYHKMVGEGCDICNPENENNKNDG